MLITDNRKIIAKLAEQMLASPSDLVSVDMTDFKEIEKYQNIKLIILNGTIESIISTISTTYASEFAEAKMALLQVSTPTVDALKMKSMQALLRSLQPTERPLNIIWGTKADPEIAQGEAEIFVVYAAD
jgi:cell division GTPase FtsZ